MEADEKLKTITRMYHRGEWPIVVEADEPIIVSREGSEAAVTANPLADLLLTIERDDKIMEYLSQPPMSQECCDALAKIEADFVKYIEERPNVFHALRT